MRLTRRSRNALAVVLPAWVIFLTLTCLGLFSGRPEAQEKKFEDFNPDNFSKSTQIDNRWLPLKPGMQWFHEGSTNEDGERIPHRIEFTVTDLTKVIKGVRTVVVWIEDSSKGEAVEKEIAFYAQDNDGNVWYLGEYPEAYEDGKLVEASTWIAGIQEARAGIAMQAEPKPGTPSYSQGWGPAINWTDRAQVYKMGEKTCVPVDCYEDVLVMDEFNYKEPGFKLKYYARGVGLVRVGWRGEEEQQETLELVKLSQLGEKDLAEVRAKALALEKHAIEISTDVYALTSPLQDASGTALHTYKPRTMDQRPGQHMAKASKITEDEAVKIAQKAVPGQVTDVAIERKLGANRYVVEVLADADGAETDVIIDMETGKVLATEN